MGTLSGGVSSGGRFGPTSASYLAMTNPYLAALARRNFARNYARECTSTIRHCEPPPCRRSNPFGPSKASPDRLFSAMEDTSPWIASRLPEHEVFASRRDDVPAKATGVACHPAPEVEPHGALIGRPRVVQGELATGPLPLASSFVENAVVAKSNETVVRAATPTDAEAICQIYNAAMADRRSTFETEPRCAEDFHKRIDAERYPFLVSEADGRVVGWAGLASYSPRPCYAGIGEVSVYVTPEARGQGLGTALTEALAVEAMRNDFHKLLGKLFIDNVASIRLVERSGFSSVGTHRRHGRLDGQWRDVLVVERLLFPTPSTVP